MNRVRIFIVGSIISLFAFGFTAKTYAITDPFATPNNFIGIHILFPSELAQAKTLVDSSGGDWGYVTIPVQIGDTDLDKWQQFMNDCKTDHIIPIIRLATEPNWENTATWRKPNDADIVDFANFLNSLDWPTKNRYVILFNEVNRYDEWGGEAPDAAGYASLVQFAYPTFKSRSQDFYLILSGMDNAAPNDGVKYVSDMNFLAEMEAFDPNIFNDIDGFASHSYPNPGFSQPPEQTQESVATYRYEYQFINSHSYTKKPVFITETGWDQNILGDDTVSNYFTDAFTTIWQKDQDKIVAITPFLLDSEAGVFDKFSFMKNGVATQVYKTLAAFQKIKGEPALGIVSHPPVLKAVLGTRTFEKPQIPQTQADADSFIAATAKWYLKSLLGYGQLW